MPKLNFSEAKNKLQVNQQKQSKLTDSYFDNILGEEVYRGKITILRIEEDELKKLIAGHELMAFEKERSEGYTNRVKDFFEGYDDGKTTINFASKKAICGLLFLKTSKPPRQSAVQER